MIRAIPDEATSGGAQSPETAETAAAIEDQAAEPDNVFAEPLDDQEAEWQQSGNSSLTWLARLSALGAVIGWSALYGWAMQAELIGAAQAQPSEWVRWIIDWSVPVLLVGVIWLIAMRNSAREANRFAATAALLSQESGELETRLTVVNRELSLAREFLAAQSRELESLGRIAADRLSTHAEELQSLIKDNGAQVSAIGSASDTALANMKSLRDDLPVVANSARDVTSQIGNAGRTAKEQVDRLIGGFERLNQFGSASENQVSALSSRIEETVMGFEAKLAIIEAELGARFSDLKEQTALYSDSISEAEERSLERMNNRLTALQTETATASATMREEEAATLEQMRQTRAKWAEELKGMITTLDTLDQNAHKASRARIVDLHEEATRFDTLLQQRDVKFLEEMTRRQSDFEMRETQASELLGQRMAELDDMLAERRAQQLSETEKLVAQSTALGERVESLSSLITQIEALGADTRTGLGEGLTQLGEQLEAKRATLAETEASLATLTEAGIRLLEIIQSGARHSREDLPEAIEQASAKLGEVEERSNAMGAAMFAAGEKGQELSAYLIETNDNITQADASISSLHTRLAEQSDAAQAKLTELRKGLSQLTIQSETFAGETQQELRSAIEALDAASRDALTALKDGAQTEVAGFAERLSEQAAAAIATALTRESAEAMERLDEAASNASSAGRDATIHLRDQLARVNELTGNLEQRIARARDLSEEQVDNDFARRVALITDSLNSSAIDINSALSTEVTDTAWDAYLKGDRGIFTRRAVRLLDNADSREIAELYQNDEAFNANVSRYIHDFEAMLRSMLSTRNGNALSVTVLGSDMGKLYVALAQAIERFRN